MRINCKIAIKLTITQVLFHWTAFLGHILDFIFYCIVPRESTELGYFSTMQYEHLIQCNHL